MEKRRLFVSNYLPGICSAPVSVTTVRMEVWLVSRGPSCRGGRRQEGSGGLAEPGGMLSSSLGGHFTPLWSLPVFAQEAIGVCFAAGFDHLPVVWFLSLSSLGGFNYLN